jgi:uncharacterized integral membrane protein (TIGR00697 family)
MNEFIFFAQTLLIVFFSIAALKLGKSVLVAWVAIQAFLANIFVLKQITLFGFDVTASDAFAIGGLLGLNFLQEYYGKPEAKKASWICFFFMVFFVTISQLHLLYLPNEYDFSQSAFHTLLSLSPRLFIASISTFAIVQQIDLRCFGLLRKKFSHFHLPARMALTLIFTQFLDTCLFSFLGLYGVVPSLVSIIFLSFTIKLIVIFTFTTIIWMSRHERLSIRTLT